MRRLPNTLASRMARIHELSGLDRTEMSERAGLSQSHIGMLIRGTVTRPASDTLVKIADAFGTSLEWLMTGQGEAPTRASILAAIEHATAAPIARARLIEAREALHLTQVDVAKQMQVEQSTISRIENGEIMPAADVAAMLIALLGVSLEDIVGVPVSPNHSPSRSANDPPRRKPRSRRVAA